MILKVKGCVLLKNTALRKTVGHVKNSIKGKTTLGHLIRIQVSQINKMVILYRSVEVEIFQRNKPNAGSKNLKNISYIIYAKIIFKGASFKSLIFEIGTWKNGTSCFLNPWSNDWRTSSEGSIKTT